MNIKSQQLKLWPINLLMISAFIILSLRFLLQKPPVWNDEAIYSDITYNLIKHGKLSTELFKDFIPFVEQHSLWYPPVYFLLLAGAYLIFNPQIIVMRLLSLSLSLISLALVYLILKEQRLKPINLNWSWSVFLCLILFNPYFQHGAIIGRMEILVIALGLASIWQYLKFKKITQKNKKSLFISGILSGLALLTHPNSFIFLAPIGLDLIFGTSAAVNRLSPGLANQQMRNLYLNFLSNSAFISKFKSRTAFYLDCIKTKFIHLIIFAVPILFLSSGWLVSFWPQRQIFILQNQEQLIRKQYSQFFFINSLQFANDKRWLLLAYCAIYAWVIISIIKNRKNTSIAADDREKEKCPVFPNKQFFLLLFLISCVWSILMKEMWYLIYFNFMAIFSLSWYLQTAQIKINKLLIGSLMILGILSLSASLNDLQTQALNKQDYGEFCNNIAKNLPVNARVLIVSIPDPYFCLKSKRPDLYLRESPNTPPTAPINSVVYNKIFDEIEYAVISYFPNPAIADYLQKNTQELIFNNQTTNINAYPVIINKLKPVSEREVVP